MPTLIRFQHIAIGLKMKRLLRPCALYIPPIFSAIQRALIETTLAIDISGGSCQHEELHQSRY